MKTVFALLALYDGLPVIPVERVCADFFAPLSIEEFLRKTTRAEIALPIIRMYDSQKAAKAVHINDLAAFLDKQAEAARKERDQLGWNGDGRSRAPRRYQRPSSATRE